MKYEDFKTHLKLCKRSSRYAQDYTYQPITKKENKLILRSDFKRFNSKHLYAVNKEVHIKHIDRLSLFEAGLIVALFGFKTIPNDYAGYHNCIAGKRFIENLEIKNVRDW